ncbi:MAG: 16S rRNA (cytosine(967)-C(5))-methyltransferase RsmB [Clostridiales bacterium]|nr:16S rRNA (cytosine(967)-C(5))-methyltransferase RsmB [Clostridiales bacterium]
MDINRKTAYLTLMDVENKRSYSNIALNHQIQRNRPDNPAFVRELVYGVLKNKMLLDYVVDHLVPTGSSKLKMQGLNILRMGLYQLSNMGSVPEYAAVNETVNLAKKFCKGRDGFINGVLRTYIRNKYSISLPDRAEDEVKYLSIKYSYEPWIIELWLKEYDMEFVEELLKAGNETPQTVIRLNWQKVMKKDLIKNLTEKGFEVEEGKLSPNALYVKGSNLLNTQMYRMGMFSVQDESSQLATIMLDPKHGDFVIDVCAAPGGKTLAIAERMNNTGTVLASDVYTRKVALIEKEVKRLGLSNVKTRTYDATKVDTALIGKADKVIVDAPCTGLGVVRRKPEIKYKKWTWEMDSLPRKQLAILSSSSKYVKMGGTLLYCTCTINADENERVVTDFLRKNKDFVSKEVVKLYPHIDGTDGFFICKMTRTDDVIGRTEY